MEHQDQSVDIYVHCSSIVVVSWAAGAIVSTCTIELDSDAAHSANVKGAAQTMTTRQSEMANTSPCHIPVLGDVRKFLLFFRDVISLLARVFIFFK